MGSAPVGAQCPLTSSLGKFLGYGLALVSWAFAHVGVHLCSSSVMYATKIIVRVQFQSKARSGI